MKDGTFDFGYEDGISQGSNEGVNAQWGVGEFLAEKLGHNFNMGNISGPDGMFSRQPIYPSHQAHVRTCIISMWVKYRAQMGCFVGSLYCPHIRRTYEYAACLLCRVNIGRICGTYIGIPHPPDSEPMSKFLWDAYRHPIWSSLRRACGFHMGSICSCLVGAWLYASMGPV